MPSWTDRHAGFGAAALQPGGDVPAGLVDPDGKPSPRRFAVYRNNVLTGLANGLAEAYPVVRRLVGEAFFHAMALEFAANHPPTGPLMFDYGAAFPAFLTRFEPVQSLFYLPDVARLERAWLEAYHAADEDPVGADALSSAGAVDLGGMRLGLHGSLRLVRSAFPVVSIWQANSGAAEGAEIPDRPETALIARPGAEVTLRPLPHGAAAWIGALQAGQTLAEAADAALAADPQFDIAEGLAGLFRLGLVTGFRRAAA